MAEDAYSRALPFAEALQRDLEDRLKCMFGELGDQHLVRALLVNSRPKSQASLDRKAKASGRSPRCIGISSPCPLCPLWCRLSVVARIGKVAIDSSGPPGRRVRAWQA